MSRVLRNKKLIGGTSNDSSSIVYAPTGRAVTNVKAELDRLNSATPSVSIDDSVINWTDSTTTATSAAQGADNYATLNATVPSAMLKNLLASIKSLLFGLSTQVTTIANTMVKVEECTNAQYNALTEAQKTDGTIRVVGDPDEDDGMHAAAVVFDNTASGLTAINTQAAIDEVYSEIPQFETMTQEQYNALTQAQKMDGNVRVVGSSNGSLHSSTVHYDNASSGLSATNVQTAVDELNGKVVEVGMAIGNGTTTTYKSMLDSLYSAVSSLDFTKVKSMWAILSANNNEFYFNLGRRIGTSEFMFVGQVISSGALDNINCTIKNGDSSAGYWRSGVWNDQSSQTTFTKLRVICEYL